MKILCKSSSNLSANQQVNRIGKYLYKNIDGSFKYRTSSNTADVYFTIYYQSPDSGVEDDVSEMVIDLNITTYQNKIRVNVIELSPEERTLGYDLYLPEDAADLPTIQHTILNKVIRRVSKAYQEYNFIF